MAQLSESVDYQYDYQQIGLEQGLPTLDINAMVQGPQGFYWLATNGAGLVRFDGLEFKSFRSEQDPAINALIRFRDSLLVYATNERLVFFDGRHFHTAELPDLRIEKIVTGADELLLLDRQGSSWRLQDSSFRRMPQPDSLAFRDLQYLNGRWYALSSAGVYRYAQEGWQRWHDQGGIYFVDGQLNYLRGDSLFSLRGEFKVRQSLRYRGYQRQASGTLLWEGQRWFFANGEDTLQKKLPSLYRDLEILQIIGEPNKGLLLHTDQGLLLWQNKPYGSLSFPGHNILCMAPWREGLILGTTRGLLWTDGSHQPQSIGVDLGSVLDMAVFQDELYLATERGLYVYREENLRQTDFPEAGFVFSLEASEEELWIGTGLGIFRYDGDRFRAESREQGLPVATIFDIQMAEDGTLWCGTYTQGVWRRVGASWEIFRNWQGQALDGLGFSCFRAVSSDELYLGTLNKGLYHLRSDGVTHYDFEDLSFAEARALAFDRKGSLWLGTNKGIVSLRDLEERKRSGIPLVFYGAAVNGRATLALEEGLFFGGPETLGLLQAFGPQDRIRPTLVAFDLFGRPQTDLQEYASGKRPFSGVPHSLQLPYDRNYLRAQLSPRTLLGADRVYYRYRLIGQDESWSEVGHRRELVFSALPAGEYRLEIQARRPGKDYELAQRQSLPFRINRPLWKNPWFLGGVIGLLLLLLALFLADRNRRSRQRLELENQLMEMERKALRLQMNPHFIFNALDSISSFIFKKDPKQAVRYLNNFAKLMRLTLESSMEHIHPVETEVSILKNYLELEKLRFGDRFHFEIEVDEEIDYDVGLPPMLLQPHVENAILHGLKPKEEGGLLQISFALKGELLEVIIDDNGVGRAKAKEQRGNRRHRSMATQINRDRMALLKRSMNENFSLEIVDKTDPSTGQPMGTRVEIRLPAEAL